MWMFCFLPSTHAESRSTDGSSKSCSASGQGPNTSSESLPGGEIIAPPAVLSLSLWLPQNSGSFPSRPLPLSCYHNHPFQVCPLPPPPFPPFLLLHRAWPLASLLVVLREHAWSDAGRQRQLHTAQSKGLSALVALAHRWSLQYLVNGG